METSLRIYQEKTLDLRLHLLFGSLIFLWLWLPAVIRQFDPTAGGIDPTIWLLLILSLLAFLGMAALCWWLLQRFWQRLGLPQLDLMVSQFKTLALWQQLGFYWVSFALLLLVAALCLIAIC